MAISNTDQIEAFKQAALTQGYDPAEVESFAAMAAAASTAKQAAADTARSTELQDYETKLKLQKQYSNSAEPFNVETDPGFLRAKALKQLEGTYDPTQDPVVLRQQYLAAQETGKLSAEQKQAIDLGIATLESDGKGGFNIIPVEKKVDPMQWVADNQLTKYLTGKDKDARSAQAGAMQKLGIDGYFKASALPDLLNDKELVAREAATALLNSASSIYSQVQNQNGKTKNVQGIGPLGQLRPGFLTNTEGKTLKQDIVNLTAAKMKEISGAAISDKEVQRLSKALPQVGDTEGVILTKAKNIADAIEIGLEMQEVAKRERLTLDEAYRKYGTDAFTSRSQPVPSWIGSARPGLDIGNTTGTKVGRFTIEVK